MCSRLQQCILKVVKSPSHCITSWYCLWRFLCTLCPLEGFPDTVCHIFHISQDPNNKTVLDMKNAGTSCIVLDSVSSTWCKMRVKWFATGTLDAFPTTTASPKTRVRNKIWNQSDREFVRRKSYLWINFNLKLSARFSNQSDWSTLVSLVRLTSLF